MVILDPESHLLHRSLQTGRLQLYLVMQVGSEQWRSEEHCTTIIGRFIISLRIYGRVPEPSQSSGIRRMFSKSGRVRELRVAVCTVRVLERVDSHLRQPGLELWGKKPLVIQASCSLVESLRQVSSNPPSETYHDQADCSNVPRLSVSLTLAGNLTNDETGYIISDYCSSFSICSLSRP